MGPEMNWFYLERMMRDRQKELLAEAAYERLVKNLIEKRTPFTARARQWLGYLLVRWGWRLAGETPRFQQFQLIPDQTETKASTL